MSTLSRHLVSLRLTGPAQVRLHSLLQTRDKSKCWPLLVVTMSQRGRVKFIRSYYNDECALEVSSTEEADDSVWNCNIESFKYDKSMEKYVKM